jgi:hypothetical protein
LADNLHLSDHFTTMGFDAEAPLPSYCPPIVASIAEARVRRWTGIMSPEERRWRLASAMVSTAVVETSRKRNRLSLHSAHRVPVSPCGTRMAVVDLRSRGAGHGEI